MPSAEWPADPTTASESIAARQAHAQAKAGGQSPSAGTTFSRELVPEFLDTFGESFTHALDLSTWSEGVGLLEGQAKLEEEIADAARMESGITQVVRNQILPQIGKWEHAPPNAGVFRALPENLHRIHCGLLFNGGVEACTSISVLHSMLPLSITQIGVCLVTYNGRQNSWAHRLFRRDLRTSTGDVAEDLVHMIQRRQDLSYGEHGESSLSELARRGVAAYAERAALRDCSTAPWRMAIGNPAPFELLSGLWISNTDNLRISLGLIESCLAHGRFVFVNHAARNRDLMVLGQALRPGEYLILQTLQSDVRRLIDRGHYRDENGVRPMMEKFCEESAPRIVMGLYRVWEGAPPCLFYAHADYAHVAAHIAIADAQLQPTRGFPMLLDLASAVCRASFGVDSLIPSAETAYAVAGDAMHWLSLRDS